MKELDGYKVVTDFIINKRCAYNGCPRDGTYAMCDPGGDWWDCKMYCMQHSIDVALNGTIKEEEDE